MKGETTDDNNVQESKTTPYLPPSMLAKRLSWDVFLSFRGEDTRHKITKGLYEALQSNCVRTFIDNEGMKRGDVIQPSLEEAIVDSALAVAIISPRYADSRWCLDELCRIFECQKRVLPVFYQVDPSEVRSQKGKFGEVFNTLVNSNRFGKSEIQKWRDALNKVGNISGYATRIESDDPELIQCIVKQVLGELKNNPVYVVKVAVGLDFRVDDVLERLNIHSSGVQFLGVHGTPGIGKTTLAKAAFNKLVFNFKNRCFISNIREKLTTEGGLLTIQNELISDLSLGKIAPVKEEDAGKRVMKRILNESRVLVVLDDVSGADQLENLGIVREWFEEGSRILVTSRDIEALRHFAHVDELYEVEKLSASESLELFCIHALGRREPTQEYKDVSKEIVLLTGGLPLALEVFGSSLVKKTKREWEDSLIKLKEIRPQNLQDVLKFSYDGLDEQEKTIFLDISCLLLQTKMKREDVVDVLEGCDLRAEIAIGNLVAKSLMKITENNEFWMHDQIRDMGRQIVIHDSLHHPWKRSRLWDSGDIMHVLRHERVTESIRGIALDTEKPPDFTNEMMSWINLRRHPHITTGIRYLTEKFKELTWWGLDEGDNPNFHTKSFENMVNLKLLRINYVKLLGDLKYMPAELRWLQWRGCPQKTLPAKLPEQIRVLDLSGSKIEGLWCSNWFSLGCNKVAENLVVINLSRCSKLTALPDMSGHIHLKKLILEFCVGLTTIHESIGSMGSLVHLNLRDCSNLVDFPKDVSGMKGLKDLILSGCSKLNLIPHDVRSMKSLIQLLVDRTAITELPEYLFHLTQLEVLSLDGCNQIRTLPEWLGKLSSLKTLSLSSIGLKELPDSVGSLASLERLRLTHCTSLSSLPDSVGNLKSLADLRLNGSSIRQLPSSICSLSYLKVLAVQRCRFLTVLPISVKGLASIVELGLDMTSITELPDQIGSFKFIKKLSMTNCASLQRLPESMGNLSSLSILFIVGAAITQLPESIGELENLMSLKLNKCRELCKLPDSIGKLRSLRRLIMEETAVISLPESFGLVEALQVLKMKKPVPPNTRCQVNPNIISSERPRLSVLPASFCKLSVLEEFDARACRISGRIHDDFCKLSKLEILNLGYNNFHSLPSTLEGLSILKKLLLHHCEELRSLPQLPSTLVELNAADCYALEYICGLSNLERLQELQLANCDKLEDVRGLECLKSLRRLYMGCCDASASAIRRRLSRVALRNLNNLSIPGSQIPDWFSQNEVNFATHPNLAIKSVIVGVVISVDVQMLDDMRAQLPSIVDIQARIIRQDKSIFSTVLILKGVPVTQEDQLYLCRFKDYHPLVSLLREGDRIQVGWMFGPVAGVELKRWGIYLVFENDDDYEGDEELLPLSESQQSVSQRLLRFFRSVDQG